MFVQDTLYHLLNMKFTCLYLQELCQYIQKSSKLGLENNMIFLVKFGTNKSCSLKLQVLKQHIHSIMVHLGRNNVHELYTVPWSVISKVFSAL